MGQHSVLSQYSPVISVQHLYGKRKAPWLSFTFIYTSFSFRSGPKCVASHCGAISLRSPHSRICGGPFKALERAGCRLGGEATPLHVSFVPLGGAKAFKLPSRPALCQSGASERASEVAAVGRQEQERKCAGPQAHSWRLRPGRPQAAAAPFVLLVRHGWEKDGSSEGPPALARSPAGLWWRLVG